MRNLLLILSISVMLISSLSAQTATDTEILFELKDALWNQTSATATDTGAPGNYNGTISGTGVKFVNNGGGGTALEYSITSNDGKIDGVTADWGDKFLLEARIKKSALASGGTNSEIHILKNVVTTGLDWYIDSNNKMVLKVGDGTNLNVVSKDPVLTEDEWVSLAVNVDLTKSTLEEAVTFSQNGTTIVSTISTIIYEFSGSQDINTTPLFVSGLDGDSYDYTVLFWTGGSSTQSSHTMIFNADSTANYREYAIQGRSSTPSASASGSKSHIFLGETGSIGNNSHLKFIEITGKTGNERSVDLLFSNNDNTNHKISKHAAYWKNTTDNLTSITFSNNVSSTMDYNIRIYQTPKEASSDNWEYVGSGAVSQNTVTTPFDITGLDGNTDKKYKLILKNTYVNSTPDQLLQINTDSGFNYQTQLLYNANGAIASQNVLSTSASIMDSEGSTHIANQTLIIHAAAGTKRMIEMSGSQMNPAGGYLCQKEQITWWNNTTDNITSLRLTLASSDTVNFGWELYKIKDPVGTADKYNLPFEIVETVDVNGDFSNGHIFSNLSGNSEYLYKVEFVGSKISGASTFINAQFNNDTGSNYTYQILKSEGSSTTASSSSESSFELTYLNSDSNINSFGMYIYPASGNNRNIIVNGSRGSQNGLYKMTGWWNNTIDEITSIKVFGSAAGLITGKLILSRISLSASSGGTIELDSASTYATNIYPAISGENAIEMLTKTGDFSLHTDYLKMTLKRSIGTYDPTQLEIAEGYKVDENYDVLIPSTSNILIYPPNMLRRIHNPSTDFNTQGQPNNGVTVDIDSGNQNKVFYGMFKFEFALKHAVSETAIIDVFIKTSDFSFKKVAEVSPTPKPVDPDAPWIINYYWNSRQAQFDWDGNAYKSAGAIQIKLEVR